MKTLIIGLLSITVLLGGCKSNIQKDVECYKEVENYCGSGNVSYHYITFSCGGVCKEYAIVK